MDLGVRAFFAGFRIADLKVLDVFAPLDHLLRRDADLAHVFSRLVEMPVKLGNPIIESEDILQQGLHLSLHDAGLLSHLRIPEGSRGPC